jgi:hypothetical protein
MSYGILQKGAANSKQHFVNQLVVEMERCMQDPEPCLHVLTVATGSALILLA